MNPLKDLYKELERKSPNEIMGLINGTLREILEELKNYDPKLGQLFLGFIFTVVGADGKVREEEFYIVKPIMDALFNMNSTMADAKDLILKYGFKDKEAKALSSELLDAIGKRNPDLKIKMLALAIYICAIDGDISRKEKAFIDSLI